ncbi:MAG: PBP1A family penicillin-binding protein [Hormoscilla sp. GUM202]|nr:PBP1A family penicillin-binding protein [Hormoscilla sp. GUM202]
MSSPQNQNRLVTILGSITQAAQTMPAKVVNFSQLALKQKARVPKLLVQEADGSKPEVYPLLGDRFLLGRSSSSCDIVVRNTNVSKIHLSLSRDSKQGTPFTIKDERSTNGIYRGKRRISQQKLRHGDQFTLAPPELKDAVTIKYLDPAPWYIRGAIYTGYGIGGVTAIVVALILNEWRKFDVNPLPISVQGPVIVYARDGQTPLVPPRNDAHRELQELSDFSPYLPKAVVASEDSRYYWHFGVDPIGIIRAIIINWRGGEIREGASTVTQQLARSLFRDYVGTEDSAARKIREALVALKLEFVYSKKYLMLAYLNRVYMGRGNYGFEDAAQFYFDKSGADLTLSEAATLVGILPAPNSYNPARNEELARSQRNGVIERMLDLGMITTEEASRARRSIIELSPKAKLEFQSTIAPYFYDYVFSELEDLLGNEVAREGNFIIETGLHPKMQAQSEVALRETMNNQGRSLGFDQGAVVTLDARTGEIMAMNGGGDYTKSQFNRATQALRQPGSTFKIFTYAAAIAQGISPKKTYSCAPLPWGGVSYSACERTSGYVDMYAGMALSENAIALRVAQNVGLDKVVEMARRLGVRSELKVVPGLVLGQSEVKLLEMAGAYAVLANRGIRNRPHAIRKILDSSDCSDPNNLRTCRVIYEYNTRDPEANQKVIDPKIAYTMTKMLQGVVQGGTGSAAYIGLGEEAGKTGTTNDGVDLWFIGYLSNRRIVTGVWLGNDNNSATNGSSWISAQLWGQYMRKFFPPPKKPAASSPPSVE